MKKFTLFIFASLAFCQLNAQGTGGFFDQQSSKEKLMLAQVAGYHTYLSSIKTGYHITEAGLNTLHDLKGGTFDLHAAYYHSLQQVSTAIKSNPKASAIAGMNQHIHMAFTTEISWQQQQKILAPEEINYIKQVYRNIAAKCAEDMQALTDILTPGKLQLTDHQRLERIDEVYAAMQDKSAFTQSFTTRCRQMAQDRLHVQKNREQLKKLYGIQ
jgi:hypothetical protein